MIVKPKVLANVRRLTGVSLDQAVAICLILDPNGNPDHYRSAIQDLRELYNK